MLPMQGLPQADKEVADLLHSAAERLLASHELLRQRRLAALDALLRGGTGAQALEQGGLRLPSELLVRAHWACRARAHTATTRRYLEMVVAAFAAVVCALEVLDERVDGDEERVDGDEPAADPQAPDLAPDLALALLGTSIALFRGLPEPLATRLLAHWGALWMRCAAVRTLDAALSTRPDLTVSQALRVATRSGLVTQWAGEAGAIVADAAPALAAPLADFGRYLGTAQKLLHDLHDLWPGAQRSGNLRPTSGNLALAVARDSGLAPAESETLALDDDGLCRRLFACGALHYAWACADQYRRHAADALHLFAAAGGNAAPLASLLDLPPELRLVQMEDAQP